LSITVPPTIFAYVFSFHISFWPKNLIKKGVNKNAPPAPIIPDTNNIRNALLNSDANLESKYTPREFNRKRSTVRTTKNVKGFFVKNMVIPPIIGVKDTTNEYWPSPTSPGSSAD